jgi:hypothetical protein
MSIKINILKDNMINFITALAVGLTIAATTSFVFNDASSLKQNKQEIITHEFERIIIEALNDTSNTINTNQIIILYESVSELNKNDINFNQTYRKSLTKIYSNLMSGYTEREESKENRLKWANYIYTLILDFDKNSPYDTLNPIEAQLFKDISYLSDSKIVNQKLLQLSQLYKARFNEIEEITKQSNWSLIIGIGGFATGIMSLLIPLIRNKSNKT